MFIVFKFWINLEWVYHWFIYIFYLFFILLPLPYWKDQVPVPFCILSMPVYTFLSEEVPLKHKKIWLQVSAFFNTNFLIRFRFGLCNLHQHHQLLLIWYQLFYFRLLQCRNTKDLFSDKEPWGSAVLKPCELNHQIFCSELFFVCSCFEVQGTSLVRIKINT